MPVVATPFVLTLAPLEEVLLAPRQTGKAAAPPNPFTAMINSIFFNEETNDEAEGERYTGPVRVSLIAEMSTASSSTTAVAEGSILTIASHVFYPRGDGKNTSPAVTLRSPLFFSSQGPLRCLRLLAHQYEPGKETAEEDEKQELHVYRGRRKLTARLVGVQQTELTDAQVLVLANYQE